MKNPLTYITLQSRYLYSQNKNITPNKEKEKTQEKHQLKTKK